MAEIKGTDPITKKTKTTTEDATVLSGDSLEGKILQKDWFINQIDTYAKTGQVEISEEDGFYLGTADSYYGDPDVRAAMIDHFGTDNPMIFEEYFKAINSSYRSLMAEKYQEAKAAAEAPIDLGVPEDRIRDQFLFRSSQDQLLYDDFRIIGSRGPYESSLSDKMGKKSRIKTPSGEIISTGRFKDLKAIQADPRFIKNGKVPVGLRYVNEQGYSEHRGGYIEPFYDGNYDRNSVVSNWDLDNITNIYKESNWLTAGLKNTMNSAIGMLSSLVLENALNIQRIVHGKDVENIDSFHEINNMANWMESTKFSQSDEEAIMVSTENFAILASDVIMQLFVAHKVGKRSQTAFERLGIPKGASGKYGNQLQLLWMSNQASAGIGTEAHNLGMDPRIAGYLSFGATLAMYGANQYFNIFERDFVQAKHYKRLLDKHNRELLRQHGINNTNPVDGIRTGFKWADNFIKLFGVQEGKNVLPRYAQVSIAALTEAGQEASEFVLEEMGKTAANYIELYTGDYTSINDPELKHFPWYRDVNYWEDHVAPGLLLSMGAGAFGGAFAKPVFSGWDPKIDNLMTHIIVTGHSDVFEEVNARWDRKGVYGDRSLSTIKQPDGDGYLSMAEAAEIDPNPIDQHTANKAMIEERFRFKTKLLNLLKITSDSKEKAESTDPEFRQVYGIEREDYNDLVSKFDVGAETTKHYSVVENMIPKVSLQDVAAINNNIVTLREEYKTKMKEAETAQEKQAALEEHEQGVEELDSELQEALEPAQASELITALQGIQEINSGRYAEKMFIQALYKRDRYLPDSERKFKDLDGHADMETMEGIFEEMTVITDSKDFLDRKFKSELNTQNRNNKLTEEAGEFAEKVGKLKSSESGRYMMSQESYEKLVKSFDALAALKSNLVANVDRITHGDYAAVSRPFKENLMSKKGNPTKKSSQMLEGIKKVLTKDIGKIRTISDLDNIYIDKYEASGEMVSIPLLNFDALHHNVVTASFKTTDPKHGPSFKAGLELLSIRSELDELSSDNKRNLEHIFADYNVDENSTLLFNQGSFTTRTTAYEAELEQNRKEDIGKNTFKKYKNVKGLRAKVAKRLAILRFMHEIEPYLGDFRIVNTKNGQLSFDYQEEFDRDLTKYNRAFNRALYNPARMLQLEAKEGLTEAEELEFALLRDLKASYADVAPEFQDKFKAAAMNLMSISQGIETNGDHMSAQELSDARKMEEEAIAELKALQSTSVVGTLENLLIRLDAILSEESNMIDVDLAKRAEFIVNARQEQKIAKQLVFSVIDMLEGGSTDEIYDKLDANETFKEFRALKQLDPESSSDEATAATVQSLIKTYDEIFKLYGSKVELFADKFTKTSIFEDNESNKHFLYKVAQRAISTMSLPYSYFIDGYKEFVNFTGADEKFLFKYPANAGQIESGFELVSYLTNPAGRRAAEKLTIRFNKGPEGNEYRPENIIGVQGKVGSGKTKFLTSLGVTLANSYLKQPNKPVMIASHGLFQIKTLRKALEDNKVETLDKAYFIGTDNTNNNLVNYLQSKKGTILTGVSTIIVDEASHMYNANYLNASNPSFKLKSIHPDMTGLIDAVKEINTNRERSSTMLPLTVVLVGDGFQNGAVSERATGADMSSGVFTNEYLPNTTYLERSERIEIQSLSDGIDRMHSASKTAFGLDTQTGKFRAVKEFELNYGYDNGDILGIPETKSFEALAKYTMIGMPVPVQDILVANLNSNPGFKVGIMSDQYTTKAELLKAFPVLEDLLIPTFTDKDKNDRVIVGTHTKLQGGQVNVAIVHVTKKDFRNDFGRDKYEKEVKIRKLTTSVGRSETASIIINNTEFAIESKFNAAEKVPSKSDEEAIFDSLRQIQMKSYTGYKPVVEATIIPDSESEPEPSPIKKKQTPEEPDKVIQEVTEDDDITDAEVVYSEPEIVNEEEAGDSPFNPLIAPVSPDLEEEREEELLKDPTNSEAIHEKYDALINEQWTFNEKDLIKDFEEGRGFIIPSNYNPGNSLHRQYILRKGVYHLTGSPAAKNLREPGLTKRYMEALSSRKYSTVLNDGITAYLNEDNLAQIELFHNSLYRAYLAMNAINTSNYLNDISSVYYGENINITFGRAGLGFAVDLGYTSEDEVSSVPLGIDAILATREGGIDEASYELSGEYRLPVEGESIYNPSNNSVALAADPESGSGFILNPLEKAAPKAFRSESIDDGDVEKLDREVRAKINEILKTAKTTQWSLRYEKGAPAEQAILEGIVNSPSETDLVKDAARAKLQLMKTVKAAVNENIDVQRFMDALKVRDDALQKSPTNFMKELDSEGIISLYTESFNAYAKGVKPGVESLIHAGRDIFESKGNFQREDGSNRFTVATDVSNYAKTIRNIMSMKVKPRQFLTYPYRSTDEKGKEFTSLMVAAEFDGKIYTLGHFNNIKDAGNNLKQAQNIAKTSYDNGDFLIGEWNPTVFQNMFNTSGKSFTPGGIIKSQGYTKNVSELTKMLLEMGYSVDQSGPKLIATPGIPHSGKAILLYSSTPNDIFSDVSLAKDPRLGILDGSRGMIILDPAYQTFEEIFDEINRPVSTGGMDKYSYLYTLSFNNLNMNLTHTLAQLYLGWAKKYSPDTYQSDIVMMEPFLSEIQSPSPVIKLWDAANLKKAIDQVGAIDNTNKPLTPAQAAMYSLGSILNPQYWGGYARAADGKSIKQGKDGPMIKHNFDSPFGFLSANEPGGLDTPYLEFNFQGLLYALKGYERSPYNGTMDEVGPIIDPNSTLKVTNTDDKARLTMAGFTSLLSFSNNFKKGIRVAPVLFQDKEFGKIGLNLAPITKISKVGLTASIQSFNYPLLHLNTKHPKMDRYLWSNVKDVIEQPQENISQIRTVDVNGNSVPVSSLDNITSVTTTMQEIGVTAQLKATPAHELEEAMNAFQASLEDQVDPETAEYIGEYLENLTHEIEAGGISFENSDLTLDTVQESDINKLSPEGAQTLKRLEVLKLVSAFSSALNSKVEGVRVLEEDKKAILVLPNTDKKLLNPIVNNLIKQFEELPIYLDASAYDALITRFLNSEPTIDPSYYSPISDKSTTVELAIAYAAVSEDVVDNVEEIKADIRDRLESRFADRVEAILSVPILPFDQVKDLFGLTKGIKYSTAASDYTALQANFMESIEKGLVTPPTYPGPVMNAVEFIHTMQRLGNAKAIVKEFEASGIINIFNIDTTIGLKSDTDPVIDQSRVDNALIQQHSAFMNHLIENGNLLDESLVEDLKDAVEGKVIALQKSVGVEEETGTEVPALLEEILGVIPGLDMAQFASELSVALSVRAGITAEEAAARLAVGFTTTRDVLNNKVKGERNPFNSFQGILLNTKTLATSNLVVRKALIDKLNSLKTQITNNLNCK